MNKDIEEIFSDEFEEKIQKEANKTRRKLYIKVISITTIVILSVLLIARKAYIDLDRQRYDEVISSVMNSDYGYSISNPNSYIGDRIVEWESYFNYREIYKTYKRIGGKVIFTGEKSSKNGVMYVSRPTYLKDETFDEALGEDISKRNCTVYGNRCMYFLYPDIDYGRNINDIRVVDEIGEDKMMEMALSFDKKYTYEEINQLIDVNLITFYWINTESDEARRNEEDKPLESEESIIGIKTLNDRGERIEDPKKNFEETMKRTGRIDSGEIDLSDIKINGVVVVGNKEQIKSLQNNKIIKHSVLGTVVDKY